MHFSYLRDYLKISSIINGLNSTSVAMFTNKLALSGNPSGAHCFEFLISFHYMLLQTSAF